MQGWGGKEKGGGRKGERGRQQGGRERGRKEGGREGEEKERQRNRDRESENPRASRRVHVIREYGGYEESRSLVSSELEKK